MSGLYVHVPFCVTRCPFCAFAITTRVDRRAAWRDALLDEVAAWADRWPFPVTSIYLGGGTPSLVPVDDLVRLFDVFRSKFDVEDDAEIGLEAHPGHLDAADLIRLRDAGLTRLSLGVQSFDDTELALLGREHTGDQARAAVAAAREADVASLSVDLLYGLPGRTRAAWERQIETAAEQAPDHVAAYVLTYEPGTPFTARRRRGELPPSAEGDDAETFLWTHRRLARAGYAPYEASNFARSPDHRCRHNRGYWLRRPYLGLGPSAHSFDGERRWTNPPAVETWARAVADGAPPPTETLTPDDVLLERWFLGLRTVDGVPLAPGERTEFADVLARWERSGWVRVTDDRVVPTPDGIALAEALATEIADARELSAQDRI